MFNPTDHLIDAFVEQLDMAYRRTYSHLEPDYPGILGWAGRMALEHIANSDALYHTVEHIVMVTLVGQEILKGKHLCEGGVSPCDWLHFVISVLCHDIGYVRGVCRDDCDGVRWMHYARCSPRLGRSRISSEWRNCGVAYAPVA